MRLRLVKHAFDDSDFVWELKHDGWRSIAYVEDGECSLLSRNFRNLQFKPLRASLAVSVHNAIIDGEIVCLDRHGVSQFNSLLSIKGREAAVFYAFDLPWLNDEDLRQLPLLERKARLRELVTASHCSRLLYAQHIDGAGKKFFEEICKRDLEGVVGKRKAGTYREDRDDWVKVKNKKYSQSEGRHELLSGSR